MPVVINRNSDTAIPPVNQPSMTNVAETVTGTAGNDIVDVQPDGISAGDAIDLLGGVDTLRLVAAGMMNLTLARSIAGVEVIQGSAGDDTIILTLAQLGLLQSIDGQGGQDVLQFATAGTYNIGALGPTVSGIEEYRGSTGNDTINGTAGNDRIGGEAGADTLTGGAGNDYLDGGAGIDTITGGNGDDIYVVDDIADVVDETGTTGVDEVRSTLSFSLVNSPRVRGTFENLTLLGSSAINGTGNSGDNVITGNSANNTLNGGDGNDTLNGGDGNDALNGGNGIDTLIGGGGGDTLNGGAGADVMAGGLGDDAYVVDSAGDVINEAAGEGFDTVRSNISFSLAGTNLDRLELLGANGQATSTDALNGTGNDLDNVLIGNAGANFLTGGLGNDTLDGGAGVDRLIGGDGNDLYTVENAGDQVVEQAGEGMDTVRSWITWDLGIGSNLDNLYLQGTANISATGNELSNGIAGNGGNNILTGGGGSDTLDGKAGADQMIGGTGNEVYVVDNLGDTTEELAGEGNDMVRAFISWTLGANVETLVLWGDYTLQTNTVLDLDGTGNSLDNQITGNAGNNRLDGGLGDDTLIGGLGNDSYVIDSPNDVIVENAGEGNDTVEVGFTYSLANLAHVENITLVSNAALDATGNAANNILTGNSGDNQLDGDAGDDRLIGNAGADTLIGGLGNDTYSIDAADTLVELAGGGTDTVEVDFSYTLADHFERLVLIGAANIDGTGNGADNILTGNAGRNILNGMAGRDTMAGGAGDDDYYVDDINDVVTENGSEGYDTVYTSVNFVAGANIERVVLIGTQGLTLTGNASDNILVGNDGANRIDGRGGNDVMTGGLGDDTYLVDSIGDVVNEAANGGVDTIESGITFSLAALQDMENLTLAGNGNIDGIGNLIANILRGNTGNNRLDGGAGADTMIGGAGNDTYIVDDAGDVVDETGGSGIDEVQSSITYRLGTGLENLVLTGGLNIDGTGNAADNIISGNTGSNQLEGGDGNDTLDGGGGNDMMTGGLGDDTFVVDGVGDRVIEQAGGGNDTIRSSLTWSLAQLAEIENLTLLGTANLDATGNGLDNVLTGNDGNNSLDGGTGNDTMTGGRGDDTYRVDSAGDRVIEQAGGGNDTVRSSISYSLAQLAEVENLTLLGTANLDATGNGLDNILTGNDGNNILDGGAGDDTMSGGLGDDTYEVDSVGDQVVELAGEGTDTVRSSISYSLAQLAEVENLTLLGTANLDATGNGGDNVLTGNDGNNLLDGQGGTDTLAGGRGDDTYVVDSVGDQVVERAGEGTDTVRSSISYSLAQLAEVENLILTGTQNLDATGNGQDNSLAGNDGNNLLDGQGGNDTMTGGLGDDTYVVDSAGDLVVEQIGGGNDTVRSSISYSLAQLAEVENLTLTGTQNLDATGNAQDNILTGNDGNNLLDGGAGDDTLTGGLGDDTYVVDSTRDRVVELAGGGTDTVRSSISYSLAQLAEVENLTLSGTQNLDATGNGHNNILTGNDGNNGLDGGTGNDTMTGGLGDDTYVVDSVGDRVIELAGEGADTVRSSISYSLAQLAEVENLTLLGTADLDAEGNGLDNILTGNDGNNRLDGLGGDDTMTGGLGDDTYRVDSAGDRVVELAGGGDDTVESRISFSLANLIEVERLTLLGAADLDGTGNAGENVLTGNSGRNRLEGGDGDDVLDGGTGADVMAGGTGDDTYYVDDAGDQVIENAGEGQDTVYTTLTHGTYLNVERVVLMGTANADITGDTHDNVLEGNIGANRIDGGGGNDTMRGGRGNDTYVVDSLGDVVVENAGEGIDTVETALTYSLRNLAHVENLTLTGNAAVDGEGNAGDNLLAGNSQANRLDGGAGNDRLAGNGGADRLAGGLGDDTYVIDADDTLVEGAGEGVDTVLSDFTYRLLADFENLTLTGSGDIDAAGNGASNILVGNSGNNRLDGGEGADRMQGGDGNDVYAVDNAGDVVDERGGSGIDTIHSRLSLSLASGTMLGNVENLVLDEGAEGTWGADGFASPVAPQTPAVTVPPVSVAPRGGLLPALLLLGDPVGGGPTAPLDFTGGETPEPAPVRTPVTPPPAPVAPQVLWTNATGNGLDNALTGNSGANRLEGAGGDDTLDGRGGDDILAGGVGNDILIGGAGRDRHLFDTALDAVNNLDRITDFDVADDRIDLDRAIFTALGSASGALADSAFAVSAAGLATSGAQRIIYDSATGALYYDADGAGGAAAVQFARLSAHLNLTADDFWIV